MEKKVSLVKIFNMENKEIGKGSLLNINGNTIIVKGNNLPILEAGTDININIYEREGIIPNVCRVTIASQYQLNARILGRQPIMDRRKNLKVRTDLFCYVNNLVRNAEDITEEVPLIKIEILNLSIGGMLITSNYEFEINDVITFHFKHSNYKPIQLEAKIIRIDEIPDPDSVEEKMTLNYGCAFSGLSKTDESIMIKYLFERQIQLYRNK